MTHSAEVPVSGGDLLSIVYVSEATVPFTELDLALLLAVSRTNNEPRGVTGMLLYSDGRFMQALEGPEAAVQDTLARISADPRHREVRTVDQARIHERRFGSWAMGYQSSVDQDGVTPAWFGSPEALAPREGSLAADLLASFRVR